MTEHVIYTTRYCPYCIRAKYLLDSKGVQYKEIPVDNDYGLRQEMMAASGQRTVPQIWLNGRHIGGCSELYALEQAGQLDEMLVVGD